MPRMNAERVTVVVGCLEPLVERGLLDLLREDRHVEILASDLDDDGLERAITQHRPNVAVLGESVGHDLLVRLTSAQSATVALVLAHDPARLLGTLLLAGGVTCLSRSASTHDVLAAVHLAAHGDGVFLSADGHRVQRASFARARLLTPREAEVFELLSKDTPDAAIALRLKITVATVRAHVRAVRRKLEVKSRREIVGMSLP